MDINKEAALINAHFHSLAANKIYPFIGKNRITVLQKGLYMKKNSNYRGIGVIKDQISEKDKVVLMGYYNVPKDTLIIPEDLKLNHQHNDLIERYKNEGYEIINGFPQLQIMEFNPDSLEYKVAIAKRDLFKKNFNDTSNN